MPVIKKLKEINKRYNEDLVLAASKIARTQPQYSPTFAWNIFLTTFPGAGIYALKFSDKKQYTKLKNKFMNAYKKELKKNV